MLVRCLLVILPNQPYQYLGTNMKTSLDLSQFYGTENYYKTFLFNPHLKHTDGVQYFAEKAGAFWFLDIIATEIYPKTKNEPFIVITLTVNDGKAKILADDGNDKRIFQKNVSYTDCPDGEYRFYLADNVLMLTSEY
jgi:hypothetical protein